MGFDVLVQQSPLVGDTVAFGLVFQIVISVGQSDV
jgi:hypothetical protein